jgi:predicted dehydrogenase
VPANRGAPSDDKEFVALKLAIIGLGRVSEAHLQGLRRLNQTHREAPLVLSAVVDLKPGRASDWVQRHFASVHYSARPSVHTDYLDLLSSSNRPDVVTILTPQHLHVEMARSFLEAGVAVQLATPMSVGMREGRELLSFSEQAKKPLVVCEPAVLGRQNRLVIDLLKSGRQIGTPTLMVDQSIIDLKGGFYSTAWRHLKAFAGAGWLLDYGVHRVHWMMEAFGPIHSVFCQARQIEQLRQDDRFGKIQVDTEDMGAAMLTFRSGMVVQMTAMCSAKGLGHKHIQIWGTKGSLCKDKMWINGDSEGREMAVDQSAVAMEVPNDPIAHSYVELLARMANSKAPLIGEARRALEAQAVIYACLESAMTSRPMVVEDVLNGVVSTYERTIQMAKAGSRVTIDGLT